MKTLKLLVFGIIVFGLAFSAYAADYKMRITHQWPENHHIGQNLIHFKNLVEEKSGGRIEVEVYPASQATKPKDVIPAVIQDVMEVGVTTNFEWAGMLPIMDVVLIPWLVTDLNKIEKVFNGEAGEILFKGMESKGVVPLMWLVQCRSNIYTTNAAPLILPKDFNGKKMRGTSKIMNLGSEALGSKTMPVSGPEVYMALQQGVLDIGLTGIDTGYARHYYEIQKYGTVVDNFSVIEPVFAAPKFWKSLPDDLKKIVKDCGLETQAKSIKDSEIARTEAIARLKEKMDLHIQTQEEASQWKSLMEKPVEEEFYERAGDQGRNLVKIIRNL